MTGDRRLGMDQKSGPAFQTPESIRMLEQREFKAAGSKLDFGADLKPRFCAEPRRHSNRVQRALAVGLPAPPVACLFRSVPLWGPLQASL